MTLRDTLSSTKYFSFRPKYDFERRTFKTIFILIQFEKHLKFKKIAINHHKKELIEDDKNVQNKIDAVSDLISY